MSFAVVIPTIGRPSLAALLDSLDACAGPPPEQIVIVDDRPEPGGRLPAPAGWTAQCLVIRRSGGRGPAAARNTGWRSTRPEVDLVVFLDDDVSVTSSWLSDLHDDLDAIGPRGAGSQARLVVPLPAHRRHTDWERGTAGLAGARWITADMAYRREVLSEVGGFDERFTRAFREDADLALRVTERGYRISSGQRVSTHPVRPARWDASLRQQRGNADDALMSALHGATWHRRAGATVGRRPLHLMATLAAVVALAARLGRCRRLSRAAATAWLGLTAQFAWSRVSPGPRTRREIAAMIVTSAAIPPAASWHWWRGRRRYREVGRWPAPVRAVLLDRDGTLVRDVAYNGDPAQVEPLPAVDKALQRMRDAGLKLAVVSNQSGIARGLLSTEQVAAVNSRVEELVGPFDDWQICPHGPEDGCACRKPEAGLIQAAAVALGVAPWECAVIGDIGADIEAANAAGAALAVLAPTAVTRAAEIQAAEFVCQDIAAAADLVLGRSGPVARVGEMAEVAKMTELTR
jgi:histidinol-phosphate phosphatase family protein